MDPTTGLHRAALLQKETYPMAKQPNFVQRPTGPTIYKPMVLPKMTVLTKTIDPGLAQLGRIAQPAPQPKPVK
jgi:hypothetical protein